MNESSVDCRLAFLGAFSADSQANQVVASPFCFKQGSFSNVVRLKLLRELVGPGHVDYSLWAAI